MAAHADAGKPMPAFLEAGTTKKRHTFVTATRQVAVRNTGVNTLWLSFDDSTTWHDVACGTSWDDRVKDDGFLYMTQTGWTTFVVIALQLERPRD